MIFILWFGTILIRFAFGEYELPLFNDEKNEPFGGNLLIFDATEANLSCIKVKYNSEAKLYFIAVERKILIKKLDSLVVYTIPTHFHRIISFHIPKNKFDLYIIGTFQDDNRTYLQRFNWEKRRLEETINKFDQTFSELFNYEETLILQDESSFVLLANGFQKARLFPQKVERCVFDEAASQIVCITESSTLIFCPLATLECEIKENEKGLKNLFYDNDKNQLWTFFVNNKTLMPVSTPKAFLEKEEEESADLRVLDDIKNFTVCDASSSRFSICGDNFFQSFSKSENEFKSDSGPLFLFKHKEIHISTNNKSIETFDRIIYASLFLDQDTVFFLRRGSNISYDLKKGEVSHTAHKNISAFYKFQSLNSSDLVLARDLRNKSRLIIFDLLTNEVSKTHDHESNVTDFSLLESKIVLFTEKRGLEIVDLSVDSVLYYNISNYTEQEIGKALYLHAFASKEGVEYAILVAKNGLLYQNVTSNTILRYAPYLSDGLPTSISSFEWDNLFYVMVAYNNSFLVLTLAGLKYLVLFNQEFDNFRNLQNLENGVFFTDLKNFSVFSLYEKKPFAYFSKELPLPLVNKSVKYSENFFVSFTNNQKFAIKRTSSDQACLPGYYSVSGYCLHENISCNFTSFSTSSLKKCQQLKESNKLTVILCSTLCPIASLSFCYFLYRKRCVNKSKKKIKPTVANPINGKEDILVPKVQPVEERIDTGPEPIKSPAVLLDKESTRPNRFIELLNKYTTYKNFVNDNVKISLANKRPVVNFEDIYTFEYLNLLHSLISLKLDEEEKAKFIEDFPKLEKMFDDYFFKIYGLREKEGNEIEVILEGFEDNITKLFEIKDGFEINFPKLLLKFKEVVMQMSNMMEILKEEGSFFVHGLLRPERLVYKKAGPHNIKILDFGLRIFLSDGAYKIPQASARKNKALDNSYSSPELINDDMAVETTDIYSVGLIFLFLLCLILERKNDDVILRSVKSSEICKSSFFKELLESPVPAESKEKLGAFLEILNRMMKENHRERLSVEKVVFECKKLEL